MAPPEPKTPDRQAATPEATPEKAATTPSSSPTKITQEPGGHVEWARQCAERAEAFQAQGRLPLATEQYRQCAWHLEMALAREPQDLSIRCFLAGCLMQLRRFSDAKEHALHVLARIESNEDALFCDPLLHMAILHVSSKLGDQDEAVSWGQRAATEYPSHPAPCATLSRLLQRKGRSPAARSMAQLAINRECGGHCAAPLSMRSREAALACLSESDVSFEAVSEASSARLRERDLIVSCCASESPARALPSPSPRRSGCKRGGGESPNSVFSSTREGSVSPMKQSSARVPCIKLTNLLCDQALAGETRLGVHEVLEDGHPVRCSFSGASAIVGTLPAGTRVRVSMAMAEGDFVWGRIQAPVTGWVAVTNLKSLKTWTRPVSPQRQCVPAMRPRRLQFGPGQGDAKQGPNLVELENIFSGLMPVGKVPLEPRKAFSKSAAGEASSCGKCWAACMGA